MLCGSKSVTASLRIDLLETTNNFAVVGIKNENKFPVEYTIAIEKPGKEGWPNYRGTTLPHTPPGGQSKAPILRVGQYSTFKVAIPGEKPWRLSIAYHKSLSGTDRLREKWSIFFENHGIGWAAKVIWSDQRVFLAQGPEVE